MGKPRNISKLVQRREDPGEEWEEWEDGKSGRTSFPGFSIFLSPEVDRNSTKKQDADSIQILF